MKNMVFLVIVANLYLGTKSKSAAVCIDQPIDDL